MRQLLLFLICSICVVLVLGQEPDLNSTTTGPITTDQSTTPEVTITTEAFTTTPSPITTELPVASPEPINIPVVQIKQGTVIGSSESNYFEFYGIPYADSTSGKHRFKAPMPPPSFQEVFYANRKNIKCVRALGAGYEGTEDCLVANVFTPSLNSTRQIPVMVWIKGKEFDKANEHELSFKHFMDQEVVVVSLNYRESILGFLCLGTQAAPGNAGLKDIIAGLRWVKENIEQFGGNPNDITLFGHGSGAAAVDLVTLSPMANGLVNKAIAQSGNAMAPWAVSRDNLEYAVQVAEALGHEITNIEDLSKVFERTSVAALMGVINELDLTENALAFAPCIEREDLIGEQPFLVKTPSKIIASNEFLQIPFMTGFVGNEGTIRAKEALKNDWLQKMDESFPNFLQSDLKFKNDSERAAVAKQIRQFYFKNDPINITTVDNYLAYHGETMMLVSSIKEVKARAQVSSAPNYLYQFSYKGSLGEPFSGPLKVDSAAHSEELGYLFYNSSDGATARDLTIGDILIERWTNFAKTGNPSSNTSQVTWQPFTTNNTFYLHILAPDAVPKSGNASLEVVLVDPHPQTINFWNGIYSEHFLDAQSNWNLTDRNEDDDLTEGSGDGSGDGGSGDGGSEDGGSGDGGSGDGGSGDGGSGGGGSGDGGSGDGGTGDGGSGGGSGNSASTAIGSTFLIVTLFSLLGKYHSSQLNF